MTEPKEAKRPASWIYRPCKSCGREAYETEWPYQEWRHTGSESESTPADDKCRENSTEPKPLTEREIVQVKKSYTAATNAPRLLATIDALRERVAAAEFINGELRERVANAESDSLRLHGDKIHEWERAEKAESEVALLREALEDFPFRAYETAKKTTRDSSGAWDYFREEARGHIDKALAAGQESPPGFRPPTQQEVDALLKAQGKKPVNQQEG